MADPDFLATYTPLANDIATRTNVDPSVVLGIINQETGGGQHVLGNNIFGISPGGKVASYPDVQTAAESFISLLQQPRFRAVIASGDPDAQARAIGDAGYGPNKEYGSVIAQQAAALRKQLGGYDENTPPPVQASAAPAPAPAPAPTSGSLTVDRVLADPVLQPGNTAAVPALPVSATPAAQPPASAVDRVLADPALQAAPAAPAAPATPMLDEFGRPIGPDTPETRAGAAVAESYKAAGSLHNWLAPAPNTEYGNVLPYARDVTTGDIRLAMPNLLRLPLYGATEPIEEAATYDPSTGTFGVTPEVSAALQVFGGRPLGFGSPISARPLAESRAPLSAAFKANPLSPEGAAAAVRLGGKEPPIPGGASSGTRPLTAEGQAAAANAKPSSQEQGSWRPVGSDEVFQPGRTFRMNQTTGQSEVFEPGRQPAGAQVTPAGAATFTPAETEAYRKTGEGQKLMENQQIGVRDTNEYIPGVTVNLAEQEQRAAIARELKSLGLKSPEITQDIKEAAQRNDTFRREHLMDTAKSPVETANVRVAREDTINADKATVFAPDNVQSDVSMQPLIERIMAERAVPQNIENSPLQAELSKWEKRLTYEDGTARIMSPRQAWGLRQDIDRQSDPMMKADNKNLHYVGGSMQSLADILDGEITKAAPGYDGMLARYKEFSRQISEQELLQKVERQLGSQPTLRFSDFQRFMKNVVDFRSTSARDLNPYKSLSDETMSRLWALRDDLRRASGAMELAKSPGSDTVPNILDLIKRYGTTAVKHGVANSIFPHGLGSVLLNMAEQAAAPGRAARAAAATRARAGEILRPQNPLQQPPLP